MKLKMLVGMMSLLFAFNASAEFAELTPEEAAAMNDAAGRNVAKYNPAHAHGDVLGLEGMDPVSFYSLAPVAGSADFEETHMGVTYQFSTDGNRLIFLANPNKYEPTYGGWCARAMATGNPVPINLEYYSFDFDDSGERVRLHFFVNDGALKSFHGLRRRDKRLSVEIATAMMEGDQGMIDSARELQAQADAIWAQPDFADEAPRLSNGVN